MINTVGTIKITLQEGFVNKKSNVKKMLQLIKKSGRLFHKILRCILIPYVVY